MPIYWLLRVKGLKVDSFEEFLNRCKIDGMVDHNLSSCNSKWFFLKIKKEDLHYLYKPSYGFEIFPDIIL